MTKATYHPHLYIDSCSAGRSDKVASPGGQELSEGGESVGRVHAVAADDVETEVEVDSVKQHQEAESDVKHGSVL